MLAVLARRCKSLSLPKTGYQFGLASLLLLAGAGSVHDAAALNETRSSIMPINDTNSLEELGEALKYWYQKRKRKVT